jgi:polyhydroxyalkanoate synthesis regulator phasin
MAERRSTGRSSGGAKRSSSSSSSKRSTASRSSASKASGGSRAKSTRSSSASPASSRSRSSASGSASSTKRKAAAKKGGQARGRQQQARKAAKTTARAASKPAKSAGVEAKTVAEFRDALRKNLIGPMEMVLLSRQRIEEALEEAVERGRMTSADAQGLVTSLLRRGQKQTNDVLKDLEQLLGRGRDEIEGRTTGVRKRAGGAVGGARKQASGARSRAVRAASPALAQADRARRTAGVGANFPITAYDDLTADHVVSRLSDLTPAQLRKVRDYERRNANRKTVLNSIESKLGA